ncbi:hypothetical protein [Nocardioides rubriscoriae]|uniref:hypothetical protein n=1 Tax=Nocardioides rubriscoriae TaxID=642762 RepID=UPI0011E06640|nr:hypothetical protein [Nocardioides rubriscoriae]
MHRPHHRPWSTAGLVGLIGVLVLALAPVATAQVTHVDDKKRDGVRILGQGTTGPSSAGDIRRVRVDHRPRTITVKVVPYRTERDNGVAAIYDVWVDTTGAGFPEYDIRWNLETDRVYVYRAGRFTVVEQLCSQPLGRFDFRTARLRVPRSCLGRPARLRVSVQASDNDATVRSDWAPGFHRYGRWTRRG